MPKVLLFLVAINYSKTVIFHFSVDSKKSLKRKKKHYFVFSSAQNNHTWTHSFLRWSKDTHTHTHTHTDTNTHTHTHTHKHTQTNTHKQTHTNKHKDTHKGRERKRSESY